MTCTEPVPEARAGKNVREVNLLKDSTGTIFVILIIFVGLPPKKTFYAQSAFVTKNTFPINNVFLLPVFKITSWQLWHVLRNKT